MFKLTTLQQVLVFAKAFIEKPERWHKGDFGKGLNTSIISYKTLKRELRVDADWCACAWAPLSIIADLQMASETHSDLTAQAAGLLGVKAREYCHLKGLPPPSHLNTGIVSFNDRLDTTHDDILAVYDMAIAAALPPPATGEVGT
jgi:hypothetical protein